MAEKPWYETLFEREDYLRSYEEYFAGLDVRKEGDFLVEKLGLEPGMKVLDLCCGQGRHVVELARRGLRVVGQDLSESLLSCAREAAAAAGVAVELVRRDMREIAWTGEFDAAVSLFTAFGYFESDAENFRVLERVAGALKPGGRFCLEIGSYPRLMRNWQARGWMRARDGLVCLDDRKLDWLAGTQSAERTLIEPDGTRKTQTYRFRLFAPHEIVEWLHRAGFETTALFGDFNGAAFGFGSARLIVIARKGAAG